MYVFSKPAAWVTPPSCSGPKRFCLNVFFKRPRFPFYVSLLKGGYVQYIFCQWEAERVHVCVQFIIYCVRLSKLCSNGERINYSERERGFFFVCVLAQRPSWLNMCSSGLVGDASGWLNAGLANIRRWVLILPRGRVAHFLGATGKVSSYSLRKTAMFQLTGHLKVPVNSIRWPVSLHLR